MKGKPEENCMFYNKEKKECNALTKINCAGCKFKKIIGENKIEYDIRKNAERIKRESKCALTE